MAEKPSNVVLNFKMDGQVEYAKTVRDINAIMNAAAKEYRNHVAAMGQDASATSKLAAEKKKLEIQMQAAQERTKMLRVQYEAMSKDSKTTTGQLAQMHGKLMDAEAAEMALEKAMNRVNDGLSEQSEESRKNQAALDNLQKESAELESQMEKLNSEFELQKSALGENATEAEKAALAHDHLGKKSEIVEKQIANMEKQLELVKAEFGENSIEANKMETELNEAKTAFNNLGREMDGIKSSSDNASQGMDGLTKVLSSAVLMEIADRLSAISDKIIDIGKVSIDAAATMRASNAQFEQVFGEMEGKAQETVERLGESFGILPNRIKPAYAAISSQFMSLGIDQKTAMELAADATTAAADAAAFYDLSLEDATSRVQSFLKGNLSAAEGIGIFASVATLNQFALEKMGKEYDKMTEAEKQATRTEFIMDMQEKAQVTGQAAREMDGWENVVGNAKSAMQEFQSAIGEPALQMFTDVLQKAVPMLQNFGEWFSNLNPTVKQFVTVFAMVVAVAGSLLPILATLGAAAAVMGTTIGGLIATVAPIVGIVVGVIAAITALILVIKNWGAITDWIGQKWQELKDKTIAIWKSIEDYFMRFFASLKAIFTAGLNWIDAQTGGKFKSITDTIRKYMQMGLEIISSILNYWKNTFKNATDFLKALIKGDFEGMKNAIQNQMQNSLNLIKSIWNSVMTYFKGIDLKQIGKDIIQGLINGINSKVRAVTEAVKNVTDAITGKVKSILKIASPSKVFIQIGKWISEGWAKGVEMLGGNVVDAVSDIAYNALDIAEHYLQEEKKMRSKMNAEIKQIEKRSREDIAKIQRAAYAKKRKLTEDENIRIRRIQEDADKKIKDLRVKTTKEIIQLESKMYKDILEETKLYINDKKSLDQLSLADEAHIWEQSLKLIKDGTKEKVQAQQEYKKAVEAVNKEVVANNKWLVDEIQKVNDELIKQEEKLTKAYEDEFNKRKAKYTDFAGTFDDFVVKFDVSGQQLIDNMMNQVVALNQFESLFETLSKRNISMDLLNEVQELGVKALPQLMALVNMTDEQLSIYSAIYDEKARKARELAEKELVKMKEDTEYQISELRKAANKKLDELQVEWTNNIQKITKTTNDEFKSLSTIGKQAGQNLLNGLSSMQGALVSKAQEIANAVNAAMQSALGGTPSLNTMSFDTQWNAKGGIFTQPTIFGASGGKLQGAGEAGPEAVLPLNAETLGAIGKGIAKSMGGANITINSRDDAESIARAVDRVQRRYAFQL